MSIFRFMTLSVLMTLLLVVRVDAQISSDNLTPVAVQLNWKHQFEFAAFYAAQTQGYYQDAGLIVELIEGAPDIDPVKAVIEGNAQFGISNPGLIVERYEGAPVVILGALLQHSAIGLLARRDRGIESVADLAGKKIQCFVHACDEIAAYLRVYGLDGDALLDSTSLSPDTLERLESVDATAVYLTNEGFALRGKEDQYVLLLPRSAGVDLYGEVLFTSESYLALAPKVVERFRQATFQGLRYAMEHPAELINEILVRYNTQGKSREHLMYEAQRLQDLVRVDLIEPGYMSEGRWRYVRDVFADMGRVPADYDMQGLFYDFHPAQQDASRYARLSFLIAIVVLAVGIVTAYILYLNRRLTRTVLDMDRLNKELKRVAHYDQLTDVPNRMLLTEKMDQVFEMARRRDFRFAVLMLDLDRFKPINDQHGHAAGDEVLQVVAQRIRKAIRKSDTVGRFGGDEFVILLSEVDSQEGAIKVAEKIRETLDQPMTLSDDVVVTIGACSGIAVYPDHGDSVSELIRNADVAMYHAKEEGGDCVQIFSKEILVEQQKRHHRKHYSSELMAP